MPFHQGKHEEPRGTVCRDSGRESCLWSPTRCHSRAHLPPPPTARAAAPHPVPRASPCAQPQGTGQAPGPGGPSHQALLPLGPGSWRSVVESLRFPRAGNLRAGWGGGIPVPWPARPRSGHRKRAPAGASVGSRRASRWFQGSGAALQARAGAGGDPGGAGGDPGGRTGRAVTSHGRQLREGPCAARPLSLAQPSWESVALLCAAEGGERPGAAAGGGRPARRRRSRRWAPGGRRRGPPRPRRCRPRCQPRCPSRSWRRGHPPWAC